MSWSCISQHDVGVTGAGPVNAPLGIIGAVVLGEVATELKLIVRRFCGLF